MNTPTPRTDAAWSATFDGEQMSAGQTARALRECSQQLETELTTLTAERDQLRADRTYNHECINRLATATGTLGEKSEKVVEVALSTIDQLRAELATEREKAERYRLATLKLDAELAEMHTSFAGNVHTENRVLQAELATERAQLDFLSKRDGAFDHVRWGDYRHYWGKNFGSLREIVDAAMKEDAK
jgi:uncharacterized protein (DUF3084 family)